MLQRHPVSLWRRLARPAGVLGGALVVCAWLFEDAAPNRLAAEGRRSGPIRFAYWGGIDDHQTWQEVIAAFEAAHPALRVQPEWLPLSGFSTKIDHQLVAGAAPDVLMFQDEPYPRYAEKQFADLGPYIAADAEVQGWLADCWPTAVRSFEYDGAMHGVPIHGGNVLIFCNLDAFDRASRVRGRRIPPPSPDWTLDDFVAVCRDLTVDLDGDGDIDQYGFMQPHWVYYLPFIWAHGAALMDDARTRWTLTGPEAVSAFAMYADLQLRWGVAPMPIEYAGQNSDTAFLSGRVALCVNGPWFMPFLRETALRDRYKVVPIPRGSGGSATRVTWDGLCIYAKLPPERIADCWKFVRFVLSDSAQRAFAVHQRAIPARRALAATFVASGGSPGSAADVFVQETQTGRLQPITPAWHLINTAMRRHLASVILEGDGRRSPEEAVAALAADPAIREAIEGKP